MQGEWAGPVLATAVLLSEFPCQTQSFAVSHVLFVLQFFSQGFVGGVKAHKASIQHSRSEETKSTGAVIIINKNGAVCARHCMDLEQQALLFLKNFMSKWMIHTRDNRRPRTNNLQEAW